ncbi:hypothetical protein, partial [Cellulomonas citrea]|uniref:hypothetical protein n=1 Tax=Cellulomonas citrea TaxID=1909423 RepID=UPI0013592557
MTSPVGQRPPGIDDAPARRAARRPAHLQPSAPSAPARVGRLVTLPTDGRRVPGTLVVSSGAAALTAVVLVTELSTTGLDQPGAAALLGLALVAAATGVYRVAARLDAPWPVRVVAALTVVLVSLGLPHMTVADAALLAGTCGA